MKKFTILSAALICLSGQAYASEQLELTTGWNCQLSSVELGTIPQYPAEASIGGQWQNIKICTESFDARLWTNYKIVFAEATTEGQIQVMVRNAAEASSYGGTYQEIPGGVTEYTNTFDNITFTDGDSIVTTLGIQNRTSDAVKFVINDVILYKADGTAWHTDLGADWGGSVTKLSDGERVNMYTFGQWGTLGHNFGENVELAGEDTHHFILTSSKPFPAGLQWKVSRGSDESSALYPSVTIAEGDTVAILDLNAESIKKSADDSINFYTGVFVQAIQADTLPTDVQLTREVAYGGGVVSRTTLPIVAGYNAETIDPNPSAKTGANGLPVMVTLGSQWSSIKIWLDNFDVTEYPGYKIVLGKAPTADAIQMFYRTETHGSSGGVYVPWETSEDLLSTVSEDGMTMTGEFDVDALDGDNTILAFALQNRTSNSVTITVKNVYLIDEDGNEIETGGLSSTGMWNGGTTTPIGGGYDDNGNIYDAFLSVKADNGYLGTYSDSVPEGHYERLSFYLSEPLPTTFVPVCYNGSPWYEAFGWGSPMVNIPVLESGRESNVYVVEIPQSYETFMLQYQAPLKKDAEGNNVTDSLGNTIKEDVTYPVQIRINKIVREIVKGSLDIPDGIKAVKEENDAVAKTEVYSLTGSKANVATRGFNIIVEQMSDGSIRAKKVLVR